MRRTLRNATAAAGVHLGTARPAAPHAAPGLHGAGAGGVHVGGGHSSSSSAWGHAAGASRAVPFKPAGAPGQVRPAAQHHSGPGQGSGPGGGGGGNSAASLVQASVVVVEEEADQWELLLPEGAGPEAWAQGGPEGSGAVGSAVLGLEDARGEGGGAQRAVAEPFSHMVDPDDLEDL